MKAAIWWIICPFTWKGLGFTLKKCLRSKSIEQKKTGWLWNYWALSSSASPLGGQRQCQFTCVREKEIQSKASLDKPKPLTVWTGSKQCSKNKSIVDCQHHFSAEPVHSGWGSTPVLFVWVNMSNLFFSKGEFDNANHPLFIFQREVLFLRLIIITK